jgi:hypothetical protein
MEPVTQTLAHEQFMGLLSGVFIVKQPLIGDRLVIPSEPFSRIRNNLWVGGIPPIGKGVAQYFDCLVLAAMEWQSHWDYPGVEVLQARLNDSQEHRMTRNEQMDAVRVAGIAIRRLSEGKSVLSTCHMGLNRSCLIGALILCRGPERFSPKAAVKLIRQARGPYALSNQDFTQLLNDLHILVPL